MNKKFIIPKDFEEVRMKVLRAIGKIRPADNNTRADKDFFFKAQKTYASKNLPEYYLIYFLFVDLLGFKDLGQSEKVSWSIPIDFEGEAFLLEHRKFGVGLFAHNASSQNIQAEQIVRLINKGVKVAAPFFDWLANQAVLDSKLNVVNKGASLLDRFEFFINQYKKTNAKAIKKAKDRIVKIKKLENGVTVTSTSYPATEIRRNAEWLALASIDAFFSWTEHIFIHIAILSGKINTGIEVSNLAEEDWQTKFKKALDIQEKKMKFFFDKLVIIRKQFRNFIAHGAFGKEGEAFSFHSGAGAVPVILQRNHNHSLLRELVFNEAKAIEIIEEFVAYLWTGSLEPARLYIQESNLPLILTMTKDGSYLKAMKSTRNMKALIDELNYYHDQSANMDW